jgi:hypothetical protein
MSDFISRGAADTENYAAHVARPSGIEPSTSLRALLAGALISEGSELVATERPATTQVITPGIIKENLRRVKASVHNTLVTIHPDGKRSYKEDRVVRVGDGLIDTTTHGHRTDRGEGTTDSISMLANEGTVKVDMLLPPRVARDANGRFVKSGT